LKARVSWLECKDACIPANATVDTMLDIGPETKNSSNAPLIQSWKDKTPRRDNLFSFNAWWEKAASGDTRPVIIEGRSSPTADIAPFDTVDFFPDASDQFDVQGTTEKVPGLFEFAVRKEVQKYSGDWPKEISGVMVIEGNLQRTGIEVKLPIGDKAAN
jgi:DsbC/DsbD-like thiol-disulfide interchange protein